MGSLLSICEYSREPSLGQKYQQLPRPLCFSEQNQIALYLDEGEIKNEEVDVIVIQTDIHLKVFKDLEIIFQLPSILTNNMSIDSKNELMSDLLFMKEKQNYIYGDVLYTHAGELNFDYMFYCILPSDGDSQQLLASNAQNAKDLIKIIKQPSPDKLFADKSHTEKYQKQYIFDCIFKCLKLTEELEVNSICFPSLTSSYFSVQQSAQIMLQAIKNYLDENKGKMKSLQAIRICVSEEDHSQNYNLYFNEIFSGLEDVSDHTSEESDEDKTEKQLTASSSLTKKNEVFELSEVKKNTEIVKSEDDEFLVHFGASYQEKIQGQLQKMERKGSL